MSNQSISVLCTVLVWISLFQVRGALARNPLEEAFVFPLFSAKRHEPHLKKKNTFFSEGFWVGGQAQANQTVLKRFEWQTGSHQGPFLEKRLKIQFGAPALFKEPSHLMSPIPYFHCTLDPIKNQWHWEFKSHFYFDLSFSTLQQQLLQNPWVSEALLFPILEERTWHWVLRFHRPVEAELVVPLGEDAILVDIRLKNR